MKRREHEASDGRLKLREVELTPPFTPAALATGIAWHAGAAVGLQGLMAGTFPPVEDLLKTFIDSIEEVEAGAPIQWGERLSRDKAIEQARLMYTAWIDWKRPAGRIIAIEQDLDVELAPWLPRIKGRADVLEETDTELVVVDLKTSASRWSEEEVELRADQLVIYRHAFSELATELGKPIVAAFEVITKAKSPSVERFYLRAADGDIDRQIKIASVMVEGVEKQVFLPNPSWACRTCPWREPCRRW